MNKGFIDNHYMNKEQFDAEIVTEDIEWDVVDDKDMYDIVFEDDNYAIYKPKSLDGLIILSSGTRWLRDNNWNDNKKIGYDEYDDDSYVVTNWDSFYVILDKNNPKKKWLFRDGYSDIYAPSYARYSCATWVAEHGQEAMWKWFLDQKFPYITSFLDNKVGYKLNQDKKVFKYPDDLDMTWNARTGSKVTKIEFAPGTTKIKARAFQGLKNVEELVIPEGVTSISSNILYNSGIKKVKLPSTLKTISKQAFYYARELNEIEIPDSVTKIGEDAFSNTNLTKMPHWPSGIDYIPDSCFYEAKFTELQIPDHIKIIGRCAFYMRGIDRVIIPNSVEKIETTAFNKLKYVYIPKSVKEMAESVFVEQSSWYYGDREEPTHSLIIDCEAESKPEGWNVNWDAWGKDWRRDNGWYYYNGRDYNDPNNFIYHKFQHVNWGVPAPRQQIREDLEIDDTEKIPGLLTDEQCDKLLDLVLSVLDMDENSDEYKKITSEWLLNLPKYSTGEKDVDKLQSYVDSLTAGDGHILTFWADDPEHNRKNYFIERISTADLDNIFSDEPFTCGRNPFAKKHVDNTLCVSSDFIRDYLGASTEGIHEDLEIDDEFATLPVVYQDKHWIVYHPTTKEDYYVLADSTNWIHNPDDYLNNDDWHFNYYQAAPLYIFEYLDTGERFLYNTRDNYDALRTEDGGRYSVEGDGRIRRYAGNTRSAGSVLSLLLSTKPNSEGVSKWAMRKWPQGTEELRKIIKSKEIRDANNDTVVYKSELWQKLKDVPSWDWNATREEKTLKKVKETIKNIKFPRNTQVIEEGAFVDYRGVESINLPNSIKDIGPGAFGGCTSITTLKLPNHIKSIGYQAFNNCKSLSGSIIIPISCEKIGESAFTYTNIERIYCEAPEKPSEWDDNWNKKNYWNNGSTIPVVWGYNSETHVEEDLEIDSNLPTDIEVEIPDDKKGLVAYLLKYHPTEENIGRKWYLEIPTDVDFDKDTMTIPFRVYRLFLGDRREIITTPMARKLLKAIEASSDILDLVPWPFE